jgi:NRAMP (natural resistance-associated macrophage protein)-like metal ion transporter
MPDSKEESRVKRFFKMLGPGLVTGAADDDPSGIGTYSQVGAQFGFGMLWSMVFSLPLMCAMQLISARIGRTTGKGIAANLKTYPRWLVYGLVGMLFAANTINIGADIAAMGAAAKLILGGSALLYATLLTLLCLGLEIFVKYDAYSRWLKWLTLSLFAYVGTAFAVKIAWSKAITQTFWPSLSFDSDYLTSLAAVFGTTISPYLFFWQASQEVQEIKAVTPDKALKEAPRQAPDQFWRIRVDTIVGMFFSAVVAYFIILTCAVALHDHGITHIDTAEQAAEALRPVAGHFAFALFAGGIIGTGLLAIPVLAGAAAYGIGEALGWRTGLEHDAAKAKGFYAVIAAASLLGLAMNFFSVDPMRALFWSAVINGVAAVPTILVILLMTGQEKIMGKEFILPPLLKWLGWITFGVMACTAAAMFLAMAKR